MPDALRVFLSSAGIFVLVLFLVRLFGKRQNSQLTFFDFVNVVVIGVLAGATSLGLIGIIEGFIALAVWTLFPMAIYWAAIKYKVGGGEYCLTRERRSCLRCSKSIIPFPRKGSQSALCWPIVLRRFW